MKTLSQLLTLICLALFSFLAPAQDWVSKMQDPNTNFKEVQRAFEQYKAEYIAQYRTQNGTDPVKVPGEKQFRRWEWFMGPRVGLDGARFNPAAAFKAGQEYRKQYTTANAGNWTFIGPSSVPSGGGGAGRINAVRVHPTDPNILFACSPSGGLWKSDDAGQSWSSNTDQLAQVIGCTDIAIDPTNPNIMYLATGDGDAGDTYSVGILKTADGGITWNTTGLSYSNASYRQISKLLIDPTNTNTIIAASSNGIWRSTDAGATFTNVQTGGFKDMEFKPGDFNTLYAAGTEFYKSTNNGASWTKITSILPAATNVSRIAIAVTPANPSYVYLIIGLPAPNYGTEGFYKSTNSGTTFTKPSVPALGTQQWYDLCIAASPTNADEIVIGGQTDFKRSTNGGVAWSQNGGNTHVDYHDVLYTDALSYYMGNDGGVYRTTNSGGSWTNLSDGLEISQMYGFGQSATTPYLMLQGWQDNGTNRYNGTSWAHVLGGDGMLCFIDRTNNQNMFAEYQNGGLNRSTNGGGSWTGITNGINETGPWVTPWMQDPVNATTLYAGFVNVWKSTNLGTNWTKISTFSNTSTVITMAVSPANNQVIWASKANGLYRTTNGGTSWTLISGLPAGTITGITCSNTDPNKAWITYSGFNNTNKVFKTSNQGATWTNYSAGVPNIPVNCITYVNGSADAVYIGTDLGVFYRDSTLNVWEPFFNGLPNVVVTQLDVFYPGNKLRASTYGRGMWESSLYVPGSYAPTSAFISDKRIDCPGTVVQYTDYSAGSPTSWSWSFPGGNPSSSTLQNPQVVYNTPGIYPVTLIATNANGTSTVTQQDYITITSSNQPAPVANNVQRCGPGPITMTAAGSGFGVLRWWDAPGGGNQLSTGSSYTTTLSGPSTSLWVDEEFVSGVVDYTGEATNGFGSGAFFTANDIRGLYFDVTSPVVLNTVDVYSNSAGDRTIEVLDEQGNTVVEKVVSIPASPNTPYTVALNFTLYPGNNYFIKCRGLVDLYRNSTGALYPLNSSFVNITGSNAGSPGYYYFFYNWVYTEITCNTSRTQVTGTDTCFVGLNDIFAGGSLNIFPNPTQGKFDVSFDAGGSRNFIIRLSEPTGKSVLNETYESFSGEFRKTYDMSKIAKGVYVLEIISNDRSISKKLVVH